ncbi:hypothetical protein M514_19343 [Trichuris suis]|uniref:Reverse transcriptase/retrotransposon-derived protein RNase H-like domain-containing protein n=1 Tax=Trichuris suis TaxID=68888 RepID=A0A085NGC1_9BILA|nr:hypothetical protein M514_19343 [Trichuris suis]
MRYLGHTVNEKGIEPDLLLSEKMRTYPFPKCLAEVQSFLRLASYYRKFIKNFAAIAKPLHQHNLLFLPTFQGSFPLGASFSSFKVKQQAAGPKWETVAVVLKGTVVGEWCCTPLRGAIPASALCRPIPFSTGDLQSPPIAECD